jgi:flagellar basal body-associated protein FliL
VFCPSCGTGLAEGGRFCPSCGAQVAVGETVQPPVQQPAPPVQQPAPPVQPAYAPPPAVASVATAPVAGQYAPPPVAVQPPPKKKRGCAIALIVLGVLLFCCVGTAAAAFFGLKSVGKPRDLGVKYTEADYQSATAKLGIDVSRTGIDSPTVAAEPAEAPATGTTSATGAAKGTRPVTQGPAKGTKLVFEGTRPIDVTLTSAEVSALINLHVYSSNWIVQDLQVKFGDDGTIEVSGYAVWEGQLYPGYALGTAQLTGPRSVGGTVTTLEAIGYEVPQDYNSLAADYLTGGLNDMLTQIDGLDITTAAVEGGQLHVVGTIPATVMRVPAGQ